MHVETRGKKKQSSASKQAKPERIETLPVLLRAIGVEGVVSLVVHDQLALHKVEAV